MDSQLLAHDAVTSPPVYFQAGRSEAGPKTGREAEVISDWLFGPAPITLLVDGHVNHQCVAASAVIMWHLWETAAGHIYSAAIKKNTRRAYVVLLSGF